MRGMLTYAPILQSQNTDAGESYLQRLPASCFFVLSFNLCSITHDLHFLQITVYTLSKESLYTNRNSRLIEEITNVLRRMFFLFSIYRIQIDVATNARRVNHPHLCSWL